MSYIKVCEFDTYPRPGVKRTFRVLSDKGPDGEFFVMEEKLNDRLGGACWSSLFSDANLNSQVAEFCAGAYHQGVYDNE